MVNRPNDLCVFNRGLAYDLIDDLYNWARFPYGAIDTLSKATQELYI